MENRTITLGGGCFWCTEAIFKETMGVVEVISGYSGGDMTDPQYEDVRSGRTGHAEVVQLTYNPEIIDLMDLFTFHLVTHDPTTLNQQGADKGNQYRSIILYGSDEEKEIAALAIKSLSEVYTDPIVTQLQPFDVFYSAESIHQAYYQLHKEAFYCRTVIEPKLAKYRQLKRELGI